MEFLKVKHSLLLVAALLNSIKASPKLEDTDLDVVPKPPTQAEVATPNTPSIKPTAKDSMPSPDSLESADQTSPKNPIYQYTCKDHVVLQCLKEFWHLLSEYDIFILEMTFLFRSGDPEGEVLNEQILGLMKEVYQILQNINSEIQASLNSWYNSFDYYEYHTIHTHCISGIKSSKYLSLYDIIKKEIKDTQLKTIAVYFIEFFVRLLIRLSIASLKAFEDHNGVLSDAIIKNPYNLAIGYFNIKTYCLRPKNDEASSSTTDATVPMTDEGRQDLGDFVKVGNIVKEAERLLTKREKHSGGSGTAVTESYGSEQEPIEELQTTATNPLNPLTSKKLSSEPTKPIFKGAIDAEGENYSSI